MHFTNSGKEKKTNGKNSTIISSKLTAEWLCSGMK